MAEKEIRSGLKFSIKAQWAPFYINGKLIAGRIMPLHRMEEKLFMRIDERGRMLLQNYYYSAYGFLCDGDDARLGAVDFLEKNHVIYNAFITTYNKTIIVLGFNVLHHLYAETNPPSGIHIDYFTSVPVNYPDNTILAYLGAYQNSDTFYRVRGTGLATIALASLYAGELHPKQKGTDIAVDLTARPDDKLIRELYIKKYGFEFYKGARKKKNDLFLSYTKARTVLKKYERGYADLDRPEGNGLTYHDPFRD